MLVGLGQAFQSRPAHSNRHEPKNLSRHGSGESDEIVVVEFIVELIRLTPLIGCIHLEPLLHLLDEAKQVQLCCEWVQ